MTFALAILFFAVLAMTISIFTSKSMPEKMMSLGCMTNYMIVIFCLFSLSTGRESFVDIAYIYVLFGFMGNLALSKLKEKMK